MKKLFFAFVILGNLAYADGFEDCMDRVYQQHQADLDSAKEIFKKQHQDCFKLPEGEEFYACQYKAKETFDAAVERANAILKLGSKDCIKYPW